MAGYYERWQSKLKKDYGLIDKMEHDTFRCEKFVAVVSLLRNRNCEFFRKLRDLSEKENVLFVVGTVDEYQCYQLADSGEFKEHEGFDSF